MSIGKSDYVAIGVAHSVDTMHLLYEILSDPEFSFGAEGGMASGYECYVDSAAADKAIAKIRFDPKFNIEGHRIRFYERPLSIHEGTRYDRLLDEHVVQDQGRPTSNGIASEP